MDEYNIIKEKIRDYECSIPWKKCLYESLNLRKPEFIEVDNNFLNFYCKIQKRCENGKKIKLRYFYYQQIYTVLKNIDTNNKKIILFGGNSIISQFFKNSSIKLTNYPEYDLLNTSNIKEKYDVVICDQVIEHVRKPWLISKQLYNILNPKGIIIMTTPFTYKKHNHPGDYFRYTTDGLISLFEDNFKCLKTGGYGNSYTMSIDYKFDFNENRLFTKKEILENKKLHFSMEDRYSTVWYIGLKK